MGVTRIRMNIDHLVLNGFEPLEGKVLTDALRAQLFQVLRDPAARAGWARSHRTPLLKLGRMPLQAGTRGGSNFGTELAKALGRGLKP